MTFCTLYLGLLLYIYFPLFGYFIVCLHGECSYINGRIFQWLQKNFKYVGLSDIRLPIKEDSLPQAETAALSLFRDLNNIQKEKAMAFMQGMLE